MQRTFKATNVVLVLLCAMYFISYIVRQSVSTAMLDMRPEFNLSTTRHCLCSRSSATPIFCSRSSAVPARIDSVRRRRCS